MTAALPPDDATLRRFLLGDLPPAELEAVGRYLDEHPSVATTLAALKTDDTLLSALRGPAEASDAPEVAAAVARAAGLVGGETPTESLALTPIGDATADAISEAVAAVSDADGADDPLSALAPPEAVGELGRLGGYRVLRLLGRGGMGAVFEAADDRLGRRVALKVMLPALAAKASARQRFLREAKAAAAVEHDHIVPIYQTGEDRGVPFLAMPLLAGETLDDRLKGGPLPAADVLRVGREVAEGLAAAHAAGLVHRDIKPSNVWLERTADGAFKRTRILDFGLARSATGVDGLTQSGAVLGTPAYMAPEQARGEAVDARADLFSLGVVLYHAATGRRPFPGADTFSILTALATTEPQPAASVNPAVPASLSALIARLMAKNPAGRPASARAVADELARLAADPPRESATHVVAVGSADRPGAGGDTTEVFDATPPRRRSRRGWRVAAAVLFLAVVGLAAANGPTIVRVVTNEGELVVEVDDPATEVAVKGGAVELRREEGGKKRVYLVTATKAGEVVVREPGATDALVTEKFQLRRGGDVLVKVTAAKLAAARAAKDALAPAATDERAALERVIAAGGWVRVVDKGQLIRLQREVFTDQNQKYGGDKLPAGPFGTYDVSYRGLKAVDDAVVETLRPVVLTGGGNSGLELGGTAVTDAGLARLATFPGFRGVRYLDLGGTAVGDAGVAHLKQFPDLTLLSLGNTRLTDAGLEHLRGIKLVDLDVRTCPGVTGAGLAHLRDTTTLTNINLNECPVAGAHLLHLKALPLVQFHAGYPNGERSAELDGGLEHLAGVTTLTWLGLPHAGITDAGLARLRRLTNVRILDLHGNAGVTGAGAESLGHMTSLTVLNLHLTGMTNTGLTKLATLTDLQELKVERTKVTDAGLGYLAALPKLRDLHLGGNAGVSDAGLKHVRDYPALADLWLGETSVTDAGLDHLAAVKTLQTVDFRLTKVTEAGVKKLAAARPDLRIHWDGPTVEPKAAADPDRRAAEHVLALPRDFVIGVQVNDVDVWFHKAADLPTGAVRLTAVNVEWAGKLEDAGLAPFRGCKHVKRLSVLGTQATEKGLANFADCRDLEQLVLIGEPITDAALELFKDRPRLTHLGVQSRNVTDAGLAHFAGRTNLVHLSVAHGRVTDQGVAHFKDNKKLKSLILNGAQVTDAGLAHFAGCADLEVFEAFDTRVGDAGLAHLKGCKKLKRVNLFGLAGVTAAGVAHLKDCTELTSVNLGNTGVGEDALPHLQGLTYLDFLNLENVPVTDAGLARLTAHKRLVELSLTRTRVTAAGLARLAECPNLSRLNVSGVPITDADVPALARLTRLRWLCVRDTRLTAAGVKALAAAMPLCQFESSHGDPRAGAAP